MQQLYDLFKWWWFYFKFMIIHLFATEKSQPKSEVNIKIRNRNQPKPIKNRNWKFGSGRFGRFIQFLEPTAHGPSALAPSSNPDLVAAPPPPSSVAILLLPLLLHPQHRSTSSLYFLLSLASRSWTSLSILISPSRAGSWPSTAWLCHNAWCGTCSSQFPSLNGFSWTVFLVLSLLLFRFFRSVSVGVNATEAQLGSNFSSSSEPSRKPNLSVRFSGLDRFFQKIAHSYLRG